jgi:hypothetical protein
VKGTWPICLSALALGACDAVWRLDHVGDEPPADGSDRFGCTSGTHDEDHDGLPDGCDLCPGIADDQTDSDGDGVGDACDPDPTAQNELALFISFAESDQAWRPIDGTWRSDGESYIYDSISLNTYGNTLFLGVVPDPPFTLEYHYAVTSIDVQASAFTTLIDADPTGKGIACGQLRRVMPLQDVVRSTNMPAALANETDVTTITPGDYRVTATYDRTGRIQCVLAADSMLTGGAATLTWPASAAPAAGALGFRSLHVGAELHYLAIYKAR